jgi:sigma-E factor negative regulatory protein RseA
MSQSEQPNLCESLSALVDGETSEWELKRVLAELDKDDNLRKEWHLHQLGSASLDKSALSGIDLSSRISAALESESKPDQKIFFFKPFSQLAVAASVAVLALVGIQQLPLYTDVEGLQTESQVVADQSTSYQPLVIPDGFELPPLQAQTVSSTIPVQVNHVSESVDVPSFDKAELDKHIQDAISTHVENTSDSLNSVLPLARQISAEQQ